MEMQRILVVDDEEDLCEILRFNLEAAGYEVDTAHSAEEALSIIDKHSAAATHHDLLLLDIMMDRMSGIELATQLRRNGNNTPVIFLTALGGHDDQIRGFDAGADDYIAKPFSFDTVLARVRAVLRRSASSTPPMNTIDTNLTRREHLILNLFQQSPGKFFTREEILEAVWPDDTLVGERSVDVHIARLRKKLGTEGQRIVNKTGFGYGLV